MRVWSVAICAASASVGLDRDTDPARRDDGEFRKRQQSVQAYQRQDKCNFKKHEKTSSFDAYFSSVSIDGISVRSSSGAPQSSSTARSAAS